MLAEAVKAGGRFAWSHYLEPDPELVAQFEAAAEHEAVTWEQLEPQFNQ